MEGGYPWNKVDKRKKLFLSEPANFSVSDRLGRNFPLPKMVWEKEQAFI